MARLEPIPPGASDDPLDVLSSGFPDASAAASASDPSGAPGGLESPGGPSPGSRVGRYEITASLPGDGRNPEYAAVDTDTRQSVVLRFVPELMEHCDKDEVRRVLREARACAQVRHPNLVHLLKVEAAAGKVYYVIEPPDGRTAAEAVADGPLDPALATRVARDAGVALTAIHAAGLTHRNVNPQNIVLPGQADEPARLKGLGLTGLLEELQNFRLGVPLADPKYTAPELFQKGECDGRADLYCLGAVYYTLLTGRPPFEADTSMQVLHKHVTAPPPDPTQVNPAVPAECARIVAQAMAKEPAARYRDGPAMVAAFNQALAVLSGPAVVAVLPAEPGLDASTAGVRPGRATMLPALSADGQTAGRTGTHAPVETGRPTTGRPATPTGAGGRRAVVIGGGVAALLAAVMALVFVFRDRGGSPPAKGKTPDVIPSIPDEPVGVHLSTTPPGDGGLVLLPAPEPAARPDPPVGKPLPPATRPEPPPKPKANPKTEPKTKTVQPPVTKTEPPPTPTGPIDLKINFQPANEPAPPGHLIDDGSPFGPRRGGYSYGWSVRHTDVVRKRGMNSDPRLDTLCHFHAGARWEFAVPNGSYDVTVTIGDPQYTSRHTLNVEGNTFWKDVNLTPNRFLTSTKTVTVRDGRLTLDQGAAVDRATRITHIEIKARP